MLIVNDIKRKMVDEEMSFLSLKFCRSSINQNKYTEILVCINDMYSYLLTFIAQKKLVYPGLHPFLDGVT